MKFTELNLNKAILKALEELKYKEATPIQGKSIPIILKRKDVLGNAQTGTGKTAAFSLPIIHHLSSSSSKQKGIKSLIVTPTRELAIQIQESIKNYSKYTKIQSTVIFGGVKQQKQILELEKKQTDILVATPGRLLDLINQGYISLKHIQYFVLDEADRMLDMGFIHDIKKIIRQLPDKRQSLFFSATMPPNILDLSKTILNNPKKVAVNPVSSTAETIEQSIYYTNKSDKKKLLIFLLEKLKQDQILVFSRTKHGADKVSKFLNKQNIKSDAIHGNKSQNQRQRALSNFKNKSIRVLVATDIAARGIDIDKLELVINFDIPNESETYVHRIGRCGRAGKSGQSISICEPEENAYVKDIEKLIGKKIKEIQTNPFPQTDKPMTASERKEHQKQKDLARKQFFANRKKRKK